jgi:hypothetical protein
MILVLFFWLFLAAPDFFGAKLGPEKKRGLKNKKGQAAASLLFFNLIS